MGTQRRAQPKLLSAKLLFIRQQLGLSQSQMLRALKLPWEYSIARISEFENGTREPNLIVLLHYSKVSRVSINEIADDTIEADDLEISRSRIRLF
jgi:transcriptional regulator with XRE-family HTH domain